MQQNVTSSFSAFALASLQIENFSNLSHFDVPLPRRVAHPFLSPSRHVPELSIFSRSCYC